MLKSILFRVSVTAVMGFFISAESVSAAPPPGCSSSSDIFQNPFNKSSAHHRPIGTGAQYAPDSHPISQIWKKGSGFNINTNNGWGENFFVATAKDPAWTIKFDGSGGGGKNFPVTLKVPPNVKNGEAKSDGHFDGEVGIFEYGSGVMHSFWRWNPKTRTAGAHKYASLTGLGHGTTLGDRVGTSASGVSNAFGVLRGSEINTAGHKIEHVLQFSVPGKPEQLGCMSAIALSKEIRWPATDGDSGRFTPGRNTGPMPYGTLMAIPRSVNINALIPASNEPGRRIAAALQNYGMYLVDMGGCGIRTDQHVKESARQNVKDAIRKVYPYMRAVLNNSKDQVASGGGTPIAQNCAFDAKGGTPSSSGSSGGGSSGGGAMGQCGTANGKTFPSLPQQNKCVGGWDNLRNLQATPTGWTWNCVNGDGENPVSCSARKR